MNPQHNDEKDEESEDYSSEDHSLDSSEDDWDDSEHQHHQQVIVKRPAARFQCPLCVDQILEYAALLDHLAMVHHLVIGDVDKIADLKEYLEYWRGEFISKGSNCLDFYCTKINAKDAQGASQQYYLLSDIIEVDKKLRKQLQQKRLNELIKQQEEERVTPIHRKCLFCSERFEGDRKLLFSHMFQKHSFNIGLADNLVNIPELLDILQEKINNCVCLYCEKTFKNYGVLKLHMRKKKHFKLNTKNKEYDRYYMINYLEEGKDWQQLEKEPDSEDDGEIDAERLKKDTWDEWEEDEKVQVVCLFCDQVFSSAESSLEHCKKVHNFDFSKVKTEWQLDLYGSIKLINYIRSCMKQRQCPFCLATFSIADLSSHVADMSHYTTQKASDVWKDDKFLQPVIENDPLLFGVDDDISSDDEDTPLPPRQQISVEELEERLAQSNFE